jgi:PadR family transcriptional regulator, regulatory protein PadR
LSPHIMKGTLDLMVLQTLETMGAQHGYGIARRIEQVSQDSILLNQGTIYAALVRLEQSGMIRSEWGLSGNNRRAKFYSLTRRGLHHLAAATEEWKQTSALVWRFFGARKETSR